MKNTLSGNEGRGFMKILVASDTDTVVGVHLIGPETAEIIQVRCPHKHVCPYAAAPRRLPSRLRSMASSGQGHPCAHLLQHQLSSGDVLLLNPDRPPTAAVPARSACMWLCTALALRLFEARRALRWQSRWGCRRK